MIYILEDDQSILDLVLYALKNQDMQAKGFDNPQSFFEALNVELPSLVVLDIMLPGESGLDVLAKLRSKAKTKHIAIICLSALGSEYDKIKGLELGADDYLTKPFSALELIARIKALLRRTTQQAFGELKLDSLILSPQKHTITLDSKPIQTTRKEFELLEFLLQNMERTFSREELLEIVWGYEYTGEMRTIDMHISTLRTKLGALGNHIKTIRGVGYKITQDKE
ncbi:phosphate regulon response regulator [Helicobacter fennelliae]|uniref:Phosphate regulon transcriptional regulatory protein PhoB n=1 Tax=Helicobacter fennelliae TaxID=215 RepID=A0A2X3BBQ3_9HELI|nr:response regulator transcription factor [Helicobacter fennelliae]SQB98321.1 phosphate regulon response regulator [Helicobacter fennelliae]